MIFYPAIWIPILINIWTSISISQIKNEKEYTEEEKVQQENQKNSRILISIMVILALMFFIFVMDKIFQYNSNQERVLEICSEIKEVVEKTKVEVAIVVGGGNFWRGRSNQHMDRCTSDHIGMLGTTMNALAINDAFKQLGFESRVQTGIEMRQIAEFYIKNRAERHLQKGRVVIFGCGTGSPFFSTDTAAALRAAEINADIVLKATNVDGIYTSDPKKDKNATMIEEITYIDVLNKKLNVMDSTATTLCMDNEIPILVYNMNKKGNLEKVITGKKIGTIVSKEF